MEIIWSRPDHGSGERDGCDPRHVQQLNLIVGLIGDGSADLWQRVRPRTPTRLQVRDGRLVNTEQFVRIMKSEIRRI